jgi:circadian clock protein KaiC
MTAKRDPKEIKRCSTGVAGLDEVLGGGLPPHRLYLIQGDPGVGKTTLALQFLLEGERIGEISLYITLSETEEELETVAQSHGWDLKRLHLFEFTSKQNHLQAEGDSTFFYPSEVELNRTTKALIDEIQRVKPDRVVFDSLSEMRMLADTPLRYRRQILHLKQFLADCRCTVLLLDDLTSGSQDLHVESIAHGVLTFTRSSPGYGSARRQLQVQKLRGVKFIEGHHDISLETGGMVVFPRLIAAQHDGKFTPETVPSGIMELDTLLGGGLDRGTSNMFMGPPGTGKSTLAMKFAYTAAERGEKVLFLIFDEVCATLLARSKKLGMDIEPHIKAGRIQVQQIDPAEISPGELAHRVRKAVLFDSVRFVVVDSINGYLNSMPDERHLNLQLHELFAFLNHQGVVTIMVLAQQGLVGAMQSSVDLTYLADTVVVLRYFESFGAVRQALSVIKKRSGNHERSLREVVMNSHGIHVGPPLAEMQGILSGIPKFRRDEADLVPHS